MARFSEERLASISEDVDLAAQILARHGRSSQPESKQICVVLGAVSEVLRDEGYNPTPTAYFAAIMSLLEKPETQQSPQVCAAMCNILTAVLAKAPKGALRNKFAASSQILMRVAEQHLNEAGVMKSLITCLGQVTAAVDPSQWPGAVPPFGLLLQLLLDERPKVRKRAQEAAQSVLVGLHDTQAEKPASDAVLRMSQQTLPGPEAAARMASQASGKQRKDAEARVVKATADALHLLGWLRMALPVLPGSTAQEIAGLAVKLYSHRHPLLSRCATDALAGLCSAGSGLPAPALVELLRVVAQSDSAWEVKDQPTLVSLIDLTETACMRLHKLDTRLAGERLPAAFHALVPLLSVESEGARFAAEQALRRLLTVCFTPELVAAAATQAEAGRPGPPPPAATVVATICGALGASSPQAWPSALSVSASLLERLGSRGAGIAQPLVERVGALCAEAAEAKAEREEGEEAEAYEGAAAAAMGAAIRHLGPQQVLEMLPLNIAEELEGRAKSRTWLLPMLRQHPACCQLMYWCTALLPLARSMGALAAAGGTSMRAMQCRALEGQLWACLPAFANYPIDLPEAFRAHARDIGSAFQNREALRAPICAALIRMCTQNRRILQASGAAQTMGLAGQVASADSDDEDEDELAGNGAAPASYTVDAAKRNVEALQAFSKNWLPLLFTAFLNTKTGQRGPLSNTIAAYAAISEQSLLTGLFHTTLKKFLKVTQDARAELPAADALTEGGDSPSEQRCTFLELALALAGALDTSAIAMLYKAVKPALQERDQAVQKRAYKILAFICAARHDFTLPHLKEVLEMLLSGVTSSLSAAKRYRLQCLQAAVLLLLAPNAPAVDLGDESTSAMSEEEQRRQVVAALVGEIVLCVKEVNQKTRAAAYGLLVGLGSAMQQAQPPAVPDDLDAHMAGMELQGDGSVGKGGLAVLFEMVMGGLVGTSPHMISASVMALARLLHQFANELGGVVPALLPAVLMLLRTKSREVVKSVLGFVKVCAMRLPTEVLDQHLRPILEGLLLWSEDSKNKFKLKVRVVVERLARRCGYDAVAAAMPEGDRRLLSHIQKEMLRKKRTQKADSEMDLDDEPEARSLATRQGATTAAGWNHSQVFSKGGSQGATLRTAGRQSARTGRTGAGAASRAGTRLMSGKQSMLTASESGDPVDILEAGTASQAQRRAPAERRRADNSDFARNSEGRMIIREEDAPKAPKPKRRPGGGFDDRASDDSDFDDLRQIGGFRRGMQSASAKSVALADTVATKARTMRSSRTGAGSVRSMGGRSSVGGHSKAASKGAAHSGDRFRAKSKSGGDVKGGSKVEPYAYWPLDRKMLNRRSAKQTSAKRGLDQVVNAAKAGAAKGRKAKRQKMK